MKDTIWTNTKKEDCDMWLNLKKIFKAKNNCFVAPFLSIRDYFCPSVVSLA